MGYALCLFQLYELWMSVLFFCWHVFIYRVQIQKSWRFSFQAFDPNAAAISLDIFLLME
jgi:hypothetical protein